MVILMQSKCVIGFQLHISDVSHFISDNYIQNVKNNRMILNSTHLLSNNVLVINLGYWRLRSNAQESDSYCKPTSICPFTSHTLVHSDYVQTKSMPIILLVQETLKDTIEVRYILHSQENYKFFDRLIKIGLQYHLCDLRGQSSSSIIKQSQSKTTNQIVYIKFFNPFGSLKFNPFIFLLPLISK